MTHSDAQIDKPGQASVQGMSYAFKYGKAFATRTHLRFAGYRYSTQGYRDFNETLRQRSDSTMFKGSRRSRLEASLHQRLGDRSSVSLTLSRQDYWGINHEQRQFQFNANTRYAGVTYNFYASQSLSDAFNSGNDMQVGLSVSMPLSIGRSSNATFDLQKWRPPQPTRQPQRKPGRQSPELSYEPEQRRRPPTERRYRGKLSGPVRQHRRRDDPGQ